MRTANLCQTLGMCWTSWRITTSQLIQLIPTFEVPFQSWLLWFLIKLWLPKFQQLWRSQRPRLSLCKVGGLGWVGTLVALQKIINNGISCISRPFIGALARKALTQVPTCRGQELSSIAWSFATWQVKVPALMSAAWSSEMYRSVSFSMRHTHLLRVFPSFFAFALTVLSSGAPLGGRTKHRSWPEVVVPRRGQSLRLGWCFRVVWLSQSLLISGPSGSNSGWVLQVGLLPNCWLEVWLGSHTAGKPGFFARGSEWCHDSGC